MFNLPTAIAHNCDNFVIVDDPSFINGIFREYFSEFKAIISKPRPLVSVDSRLLDHAGPMLPKALEGLEHRENEHLVYSSVFIF